MKFSSIFKKTGSAAIALLLLNHLQAQKGIQVTNNSNFDRNEIIAIPYQKFAKHFNADTVFTIKNAATGNAEIHQIEKLGTAYPQNVLIQVAVKANETINLKVVNEKNTAYSAKTFGRYVPERKDDFAWENDKVAFRFYGKTLEGSSEDAQGIDYWAKRTPQLIINKWYKTDDYHKDHGDGMDYYSVGQTLGVGDMALYLNDSIQYTQHYRTFKVLDNGPLRTTFQLVYPSQNIKGNEIAFSKTVSLDAGEQFNKIVIHFKNMKSVVTPIVIGLSRRNETDPLYAFDKKNGSLVYWEPDINKNGHTGTAAIAPHKKLKLITDNPKQFLLQLFINNNQPLVYYTGAAWDKAGEIKSFEEWEKTTDNFFYSRNHPLKVKLK